MTVLGETYLTRESPDQRLFLFFSEMPKGVIPKVVLIESMGGEMNNLAFGDYLQGRVVDSIISNNEDAVTILNTKCAYDFLKKPPRPNCPNRAR